jgi:F-type H+-transporting ATPase subunit b
MLSIHIEQILSQIVAFLIMFWILKRYAWKPLSNILEERTKKIAGEFESIAQEKNELALLNAQYHERLKKIEEEARSKIQEGINKGNQLAVKIQEQAHQQAAELMNRTKEEIGLEIAKGKAELKGEVVSMAISMTQKILHKELDAGKQKQLLSEFIKEAELE